ncbi:calcium-dependent protein kinase [Plakobranchus ocellatus]|uniref:Calcium-dependent protein kinase n=1 Tax=Plakobranchus ocellatus TaxID=259542 RepID=A0AAV4BAZ0_9GAST|nr:calcium-dependent protein kinase [Plakobranchus ocellatus]
MDDKRVEELVKKYAFNFDEADKDKSGALSITEVTEVLRGIGFSGSDEEAQRMFAHLDKNKDDKITRDEFESTLKNLPKMTISCSCAPKIQLPKYSHLMNTSNAFMLVLRHYHTSFRFSTFMIKQ